MKVYKSSGLIFDEGEIPECKYCECTANNCNIFETNTSGIEVCGCEDCMVQHCLDVFDEITLED